MYGNKIDENSPNRKRRKWYGSNVRQDASCVKNIPLNMGKRKNWKMKRIKTEKIANFRDVFIYFFVR